MRLSDLVRLRNNLKNFSSVATRERLEELDGHLTQQLNIPMHSAYSGTIDEFVKHLDNAERELNTLEERLPTLIANIEQEISEITKEYLARGYMINGFYGSNATDLHTERHDRLMPISDDTRGEIVVKIRGYTEWHYPTLEIGPGDGAWTEHLVAADPLYIIDRQPEFLESTLSKFNGVYRNRVRPYLTGLHANNKEEHDLSMLPQNQFGFVFAWNVFNYFPLAETTAMLESCYNVLRPGGVMMFSYNNCDIPQCVEYVEQGFRSWMPKDLLIETCKKLGYEIIDTRAIEETVHWIEIRKPGELKTVKAHQVLGKISNVNT